MNILSFPTELQLLIINIIPCEYHNIRLICQRWNKIIEETDYGHVLKFAQCIKRIP